MGFRQLPASYLVGPFTGTYSIDGLFVIGNPAGARAEIGTNGAGESGVRLYSDATTKTVNLNSTDGSVRVVGALQTSVTGRRVTIDRDPSTAAPAMLIYRTDGTAYARVTSFELFGALNANPGFETNLSDWSTVSATLTRFTGFPGPWTGDAAAKLVPAGGVLDVYAFTGEVPVTAAVQYVITVQLLSLAGYASAYVAVAWYNASHVLLSTATQPISLPADGLWHHAINAFIAPAGAAFARLRVGENGTPPASAELYIDVAMIFEDGKAPETWGQISGGQDPAGTFGDERATLAMKRDVAVMGYGNVESGDIFGGLLVLGQHASLMAGFVSGNYGPWQQQLEFSEARLRLEISGCDLWIQNVNEGVTYLNGNYPSRIKRGKVWNSAIDDTVTGVGTGVDFTISSGALANVAVAAGRTYRAVVVFELAGSVLNDRAQFKAWNGAVGGAGQIGQQYIHRIVGTTATFVTLPPMEFVWKATVTQNIATLNFSVQHFSGTGTVTARVNPNAYLAYVEEVGDPALWAGL